MANVPTSNTKICKGALYCANRRACGKKQELMIVMGPWKRVALHGERLQTLSLGFEGVGVWVSKLKNTWYRLKVRQKSLHDCGSETSCCRA